MTARSWVPLAGTASAELKPRRRQSLVANQWKRGVGDVEFVNGGVTGDVAWLVMIERATVILDEEVGEQRWDLRVDGGVPKTQPRMGTSAPTC